MHVKEGYSFTSPKRVTSPTWGPPPPCKQALKAVNESNGDSAVPAENLTSFCFEAARRLNFRTVKVVLGRDA